MDEKPILLYLYNGHDVKDKDATFSREVEAKTFKDKRIIHVARRFSCEKICFGCRELTVHVPHRRVLGTYTRELATESSVDEETNFRADVAPEGTARIVLMDSTGKIVKEFNKPPTPAALLSAMRLTEKENKLRKKLAGTGDLSG